MSKRNDSVDFKKYCSLVKKHVVNPVDINELNEMYISWKEMNKEYEISATEDIMLNFEERTINKHRNCLKRNLYK